MKFLAIAICAALGLGYTLTASAQTFAAPACDNGCSVFNDTGKNFYYGVKPKSFRVCSAKLYSATITVNNEKITVPGTTRNVRGCIDVSGNVLSLVDGEILVGALPD